MNKKESVIFANKIATFYDSSACIEDLKDVLRNVTFTCIGDRTCIMKEDNSTSPLWKITLEEPNSYMVLPNPYYVRNLLKTRDFLLTWLLFITIIKDYYCISSNNPPYSSIKITPCYLDQDICLCGKITLV